MDESQEMKMAIFLMYDGDRSHDNTLCTRLRNGMTVYEARVLGLGVELKREPTVLDFKEAYPM